MASADQDQPDPQPPYPDAAPGEQLPRPLFVKLAVLLAIAGTLLGVGLIGWRWYHVRFPNAAIFVRGDATTDGTEVVVAAAGEDGAHVLFRGRLTEANQYSAVVLVEQGFYTVRATRDGEDVLESRTYVPNGSGALLIVPPRPGAATQPAAAASPSEAE